MLYSVVDVTMYDVIMMRSRIFHLSESFINSRTLSTSTSCLIMMMRATAVLLLLTGSIQHANAFSGPVLRYAYALSPPTSTLLRRGGALSSSRNFDLDNNDRAHPSRIERTEAERAYIESVLRNNVLFEDVVRQGSLMDLASSFDVIEYEKGEVIFEQGEKIGAGADFLLILEEGKCSITIDGEELPDPYGTMKRGAMVGELALLMDKDRAATVKAKTKVVAYRLNRTDFKNFMAGPLVKADDIKTEIKKIDQVIDKISGVKTRYGGDIIRQYKPARKWLWGRWKVRVCRLDCFHCYNNQQQYVLCFLT